MLLWNVNREEKEEKKAVCTRERRHWERCAAERDAIFELRTEVRTARRRPRGLSLS